MKYIFVTGGVVSGLGKGICAASLGRLLKQCGLRVKNQKFDPYFNVDPGTMSPFQHGEVFVTEDGAETDLDLGHYERFVDESLDGNASVSSGKVFWTVLNRERQGGYLGGTVQIIPHITDEIKRRIYAMEDGNTDVVISEIGGTVGDIESQPYPRTDSRHLTGDMAETASVVLHLAARVPPFDACPEFFPDVAALVNDKEVSDHHALIPTLELEKADVPALPVGERNILLLVCCKLLCAAAEPFVYEVVTAAFECGGYTFTAKGKQVLSQGWRAIQEVFRSSLKEKPEDEDAGGVLPALTEGQVFEPVTASVTEHFTSPPRPYTEDSLLAAMENAGKEDIPEDAERRGLGTPATRAAIIEKLVSGGFVERKGKNLIPTKAGVNLVTVLPELLTSPKLTADWEQRLNEVAKDQVSPEDFMDGIEAMAAELVRKYSHISEDGQKLFQPEKETVGLCPRCGKQVYEGKKNFACSDRACQFVMWKNDRFWTSRRKEMTRKMAADLLKKGRTSVKGMWSEKKGSTYDAVVILDDTGGKYVNFKLEFPKRKDGVHGKK